MIVVAEADGYAYARGDFLGKPVIDLELQPEVAIDGLVVDAAGKPVTGALVTTEPGGSVLANDDGRFHIGGLQPGAYSLRASSDRAVGEIGTLAPLVGGQHIDNVTIALHAVPVLTIVATLEDGSPCEGDASIGREASRPLRNGRTSFALPPDNYGFAIECKDAYLVERDEQDHQRSLAHTTDEVKTYTFRRDAVVQGIVRDDSGAAVPYARVQGGLSSTESNLLGVYELHVKPGRVNLQTFADRYAFGDEELVVPESGLVHDVRLRRGGVLEGIVVDPDGVPQANVHVTCCYLPDQLTRADGTFRIEGVTPEMGSVLFATTETAPTVTQEYEIRGDQTLHFRLVIASRGRTIEGHVVDATGIGVEYARVDLRSADTDGRRVMLDTDANGHFTAHVPAGDLTIEVSRADLPPVKVEHVVGNEVTIAFPNAGTVHAIARDASGRALTQFEAQVDGRIERQKVVSADGRFTFHAVANGQHLFSVTAGDRYGQAAAMIDDAHREVVITLDDSLTITGIVVDGDGKPIDDHGIVVIGGHSGTTDASGRFTVRGLPHGPLALKLDGTRTILERTIDSGSLVDVGTIVVH
ncbi:MAG: carboxypeptidase-like regulatory domain-containing protein [Kofleriaceae bacterium]